MELSALQATGPASPFLPFPPDGPPHTLPSTTMRPQTPPAPFAASTARMVASRSFPADIQLGGQPAGSQQASLGVGPRRRSINSREYALLRRGSSGREIIVEGAEPPATNSEQPSSPTAQSLVKERGSPGVHDEQGVGSIHLGQHPDRGSPGQLWRHMLWSLLVVGPLVVVFWRGWWVMADVYFPPAVAAATEDGTSTHSATLLLSAFGVAGTCLAMQQPRLLRWARQHRGGVLCSALERLYTLACAVSVVWFWRAIWLTLDYHLLPHAPDTSALLCCVGATVALTGLGSLRSATAAPMGYLCDGTTDAWDYLGSEAFHCPKALSFFCHNHLHKGKPCEHSMPEEEMTAMPSTV